MNYMHNWTSPETKKRKHTTPKVMNLLGDHSIMMQNVEHSTLLSTCAQLKNQGCRGWSLLTLAVQLKWWFPGTAGSNSTLTRPTGETKKKADCFTLLERITRLKIFNSEIKLKRRNSYLERYSPKGSYTCSEPSLRILMWNASYVQKHSKNTWQEWVGERTRKTVKAAIAIVRARG